jgi:hypothetical protein
MNPPRFNIFLLASYIAGNLDCSHALRCCLCLALLPVVYALPVLLQRVQADIIACLPLVCALGRPVTDKRAEGRADLVLGFVSVWLCVVARGGRGSRGRGSVRVRV